MCERIAEVIGSVRNSEQITAAVCKICGVDDGLLLRQNRSDARLAVAAMGRSFNYSQRAVGEVLGIGRAGFSMGESPTRFRAEISSLARSMHERACVNAEMFTFVDLTPYVYNLSGLEEQEISFYMAAATLDRLGVLMSEAGIMVTLILMQYSASLTRPARAEQ